MKPIGVFESHEFDIFQRVGSPQESLLRSAMDDRTHRNYPNNLHLLVPDSMKIKVTKVVEPNKELYWSMKAIIHDRRALSIWLVWTRHRNLRIKNDVTVKLAAN